MTRLSLWALPSAADTARFAAISERLAAATNTAPVRPHITVVGSVATDAKVLTHRFRVPLVALADEDSKTRCLTVTAEIVEPLVALRGDAAGPYQPHLSLLYAELPAARRAQLRTSVTVALPTAVEIVALALVDTTDDDHANWSEVWRQEALNG